MDLIADLLLTAGALGVAFYCFVLSRRLTRFTDLEKGVGGAVAVLSAQVDDLDKAVEKARNASTSAETDLKALTDRADAVARRLELHLASLHDLPDPAGSQKPAETLEEPVADLPGEPVASERHVSIAESLEKPAADPLGDPVGNLSKTPAAEGPQDVATTASAVLPVNPGVPSFFQSHRSTAREIA